MLMNLRQRLPRQRSAMPPSSSCCAPAPSTLNLIALGKQLTIQVQVCENVKSQKRRPFLQGLCAGESADTLSPRTENGF